MGLPAGPMLADTYVVMHGQLVISWYCYRRRNCLRSGHTQSLSKIGTPSGVTYSNFKGAVLRGVTK